MRARRYKKNKNGNSSELAPEHLPYMKCQSTVTSKKNEKRKERERERENYKIILRIKESDRRVNIYLYIPLKKKNIYIYKPLEVKRIHSYIIYITH